MNILHRSPILGLAVLAAACGPHLAAANEDQKPRTDLQKQVSKEIERLRQQLASYQTQGR